MSILFENRAWAPEVMLILMVISIIIIDSIIVSVAVTDDAFIRTFKLILLAISIVYMVLIAVVVKNYYEDWLTIYLTMASITVAVILAVGFQTSENNSIKDNSSSSSHIDSSNPHIDSSSSYVDSNAKISGLYINGNLVENKEKVTVSGSYNRGIVLVNCEKVIISGTHCEILLINCKEIDVSGSSNDIYTFNCDNVDSTGYEINRTNVDDLNDVIDKFPLAILE